MNKARILRADCPRKFLKWTYLDTTRLIGDHWGRVSRCVYIKRLLAPRIQSNSTAFIHFFSFFFLKKKEEFTMTDSLSAATCAIYVILAFPVLYLLFKHGRNGFLGWLFLFVFCGLRIISGGLGVKSSDSAAASIISNIGLSPLLLTTAGILHEA